MLLKKTNKITKVLIDNIANLNELRRKMEEIAYDYLYALQVQPEKFTAKDPHKLYKGIKGFFMVHDVDKITIYNRYLEKGYLYNYTVLKKITTFSIITHKNIGVERYKETNQTELDKIQYKLTKWSELHEDIIDREKDDSIKVEIPK